MRELLTFNWQAVDNKATLKVSIGLLVMMGLTAVTGETWLATALVALFAWLANVPGPLRDRIGGMVAFGIAAAALTLVFGWIGLEVWPNVALISVVSFVGTAAMIWGMRAFMVGWTTICWAIYGPFMVEMTSTVNCLLAIAVGTGVVIALNVVGDYFDRSQDEVSVEGEPEPESPSNDGPDLVYILGYALTVSVALSLTTYYGWVELKTDPTLMVGGAFFVIGFDMRKTWVAGIARIIGLAGGVFVGLLIAQLVGPGLMLDLIAVLACGLSFGLFAVHPGAWMFFFMIFVAIGWVTLDPDAFALTANERFYGETMGVAVAMMVIVILQFWQKRRAA